MNPSQQFNFITSLGLNQPLIAEEVKALWRKNNIIEEGPIMDERIREIAILARHREGSIAGVTTVRKIQAKLFNNNYFYEFRCFVDPDFRQPALDTQLVVKTKELLQHERIKDEKPAIGLLMVVENEALKQWTRAIWVGADFYFAGFTSKGHHIRVSYFKDVFI